MTIGTWNITFSLLLSINFNYTHMSTQMKINVTKIYALTEVVVGMVALYSSLFYMFNQYTHTYKHNVVLKYLYDLVDSGWDYEAVVLYVVMHICMNNIIIVV